MNHLKYFESREQIWNVNKDDIKDIFIDLIDDFQIMVTFGKKLHQFNIIDNEITNQDTPHDLRLIKLGFQPYIQVRLVNLIKTSPYRLNQYINSDDFLDRKSEIVARLNYHDLDLIKVHVDVSSIIFLIYKK